VDEVGGRVAREHEGDAGQGSGGVNGARAAGEESDGHAEEGAGDEEERVQRPGDEAVAVRGQDEGGEGEGGEERKGDVEADESGGEGGEKGVG
jgi:hypothetical protein